uniref:Uncharacterized protein n=1 Tax=viral metagenome TaxID=1070528 RepID=A0A6M3JP92_9ZZZZ
MVWPFKILDVKEPIKVVSEYVYPGDRLFYEIDFEKHVDTAGILNRKLVDGFVIDLGDVSVPSKARKNIVTASVKIPAFTPPGRYRLRWSVTYKINPLRTIVRSFESEYFHVIEQD